MPGPDYPIFTGTWLVPRVLLPAVSVQEYTCVPVPVPAAPADPGAPAATVTVNNTLADFAAVQVSGASLVAPRIG